MDERLVFVNIGWMVSYQGDANDPTLGGHGYPDGPRPRGSAAPLAQ